MTQHNITKQDREPDSSPRDLGKLAEREEQEGIVDQQTASAPASRGGSDEEREGGGEASVGVPPAAGELRGRAGDPAEGKR